MNWMIRLGLWLARYGGWEEQSAPQEHVSQLVLERARELTQTADTMLAGGEAKRHWVYARLIKDFPTTNKRELALAIELALFAPKEG